MKTQPLLDDAGQKIPASVPSKLAARVQFWDDERNLGNSLIVSVRRGWAFDPANREHVRGFDTVKGALGDLREVSPCTCGECSAPEVLP